MGDVSNKFSTHDIGCFALEWAKNILKYSKSA
jgi:hypothetical protein